MSQINPFVACIELSRYARLVNVAFRVLADGTVETDSVEEALKLRAALLKESRKQAAPDRKPPREDYLSEDTKQFIYAVGMGPLTSDQIAEEAKISIKSIPPIVRGLNKWANRHGFNLNDVLIRTQTSVKGKPVSTYELTDRGISKFLPFINSPASDSPTPSENPEKEKPE